MSQSALPFFDSAEEATKHAMQASGKNPKAVAAALWPEKSADAARTALLNALNPNRDERLTADQHLFIANYCGEFSFVQYICLKTSHAQPVLQTPTEHAARLQSALFAKTDELRGLLSQIEALKPRLQAAA